MLRWLRRYWIALAVTLVSYVWFVLDQPARIVIIAGSKTTSTISLALLEMAARQVSYPPLWCCFLAWSLRGGVDGCGTDKRLAARVTLRYIGPYPFPG